MERNSQTHLAASAPTHCCDGWAFLGRAVASYLRGDPDTARRAYYAELRAAMAMLATEGIGIFSRLHFSIDKQQKASIGARTGTHVATWAILEEWASRNQAADLMGRILTPRDIPMNDWLNHFSPGAVWAPVAEDWLRVMGLDLKRLSADRDARNEASYRPTQLNPCAANTPEAIAAICAEPVAAARAEQHLIVRAIDRELLRLTLELAFRSSTGRSSKQAPKRFHGAVAHTVSENINGEEDAGWIEYLTRTVAPYDSSILQLARASRMVLVKLAPHGGDVGGG